MKKAKDTLNLRFFSSDKLILITSNKVASRYVSSFFEKASPTNYGTLLNVDSDFNLISVDTQNAYETYYTFDKFSAIQKTQEEWESIMTKKNKKDVLFLYRDPYERTLSGIVQEFIISIEYIKHTFIAKLFIEEHMNSSPSLYYRFKNGSLFGASESDKLDATDEIYKLYESFLINYIEFESSNLIKKHHIRPYLIYLYDFIKNSNIDLNKLYLFNIDDSDIDLKETLLKYELTRNSQLTEKFSMGSNSLFKDILKNIIDQAFLNNSNLGLLNSIEYFYNMADIENTFFNKIKKLPQNIKK